MQQGNGCADLTAMDAYLPSLSGQGAHAAGCRQGPHSLISLKALACLQSLKQQESIVAELAAASKAIESSSNRGAKLLVRYAADNG